MKTTQQIFNDIDKMMSECPHNQWFWDIPKGEWTKYKRRTLK